MVRSATNRAVAAILVPALGAVIVCAGLAQVYVHLEHTPIQQLQQAPPNTAVRLEGVVVATAPAAFWLQDSTGALPIPLSPSQLGLHLGDALLISAVRTAPPSANNSLSRANPPVRHRLARSPAKAPDAARPSGDNQAAPPSFVHAVSDGAISVTNIQQHDIRWTLFPALALVWLFFLNRRVRLQKADLRHQHPAARHTLDSLPRAGPGLALLPQPPRPPPEG